MTKVVSELADATPAVGAAHHGDERHDAPRGATTVSRRRTETEAATAVVASVLAGLAAAIGRQGTAAAAASIIGGKAIVACVVTISIVIGAVAYYAVTRRDAEPARVPVWPVRTRLLTPVMKKANAI